MTTAAEVLKKLPVGFRFHPTEVELVSYYLQNKILGLDSHANLIIADIDILRYEPWDLPAKSLIKSDDDEWFFFSRPEYMPTQRNQIKRSTKRSTKKGYWKSTCKERSIEARGGRVVGNKRILTFYIGSNRSSEITNWVIHEYYIPQTNPTAKQALNWSLDGFCCGTNSYLVWFEGVLVLKSMTGLKPKSLQAKLRDIVLCRLIKKPGKKTGAATCDEGGPSTNASDVENELQPVHDMDIQMPPIENRDYFERESDRLLASSHSNAVYIGLQSGFGDDEPIDGFPEYLESAIVYQDQESNDELIRNAHFNDSTVSPALRVVCADGVRSDTDTDALPAQVKFSSGPSRRDRDVMLHERVHLQGGFLSEEGQSDSVNLFLSDSSDNEATPTFQINSVHVAFDEYYTNERGRTTRSPLRSPRDAVKLPEKPKPAPEKSRPVLAFDEYYTNERGPLSFTRDAVILPEKPKEPERPKPRPAVNLPKESIPKVNKDKKVTQGKGSSFISWETIPVTSPPSVYIFNAVFGTIWFIIFARELVLHGNWC